MDTSETYIKMCDCPEIQEQWLPKIGVYYQWWDKRYKEVRQAIWTKGCASNRIGFRQKFIWLPRQDQIQKMIGKTELVFCIYQIGSKWGGEIICDRDQIFSVEASSPEQVWLAFCIWATHKKVWDEDIWK